MKNNLEEKFKAHLQANEEILWVSDYYPRTRASKFFSATLVLVLIGGILLLVGSISHLSSGTSINLEGLGEILFSFLFFLIAGICLIIGLISSARYTPQYYCISNQRIIFLKPTSGAFEKKLLIADIVKCIPSDDPHSIWVLMKGIREAILLPHINEPKVVLELIEKLRNTISKEDI